MCPKIVRLVVTFIAHPGDDNKRLNKNDPLEQRKSF